MRRLATWTLAIGVLATLVILGLSKIDLREVGRALAHVQLGWVGVAALLMAGTFLARGESWYSAIRAALPGAPVGRARVTRVLLIGMFGSSVAPGRLGEAARAWLVARHAGARQGTLAIVIGTLLSQTFLNVIGLLILAAIALAGGAIPGAHAGAIAAVAVVPAVILLALMLGPRLMRTFAAVGRGPLGRAVLWVNRQLGDVARGLAVFGRLRTTAHSAGFQLLGWALQTGTCYAVLLAFGLQGRTGLAAAAAVLFAVNVTAVLPLTPSNVGVFQAACIGILVPLGIRSGTALAYGLVLQAIEIACATLLGLPSLLREGISLSYLRQRTPLRDRGAEMLGSDPSSEPPSAPGRAGGDPPSSDGPVHGTGPAECAAHRSG